MPRRRPPRPQQTIAWTVRASYLLHRAATPRGLIVGTRTEQVAVRPAASQRFRRRLLPTKAQAAAPGSQLLGRRPDRWLSERPLVASVRRRQTLTHAASFPWPLRRAEAGPRPTAADDRPRRLVLTKAASAAGKALLTRRRARPGHERPSGFEWERRAYLSAPHTGKQCPLRHRDSLRKKRAAAKLRRRPPLLTKFTAAPAGQMLLSRRRRGTIAIEATWPSLVRPRLILSKTAGGKTCPTRRRSLGVVQRTASIERGRNHYPSGHAGRYCPSKRQPAGATGRAWLMPRPRRLVLTLGSGIIPTLKFPGGITFRRAGLASTITRTAHHTTLMRAGLASTLARKDGE